MKIFTLLLIVIQLLGIGWAVAIIAGLNGPASPSTIGTVVVAILINLWGLVMNARMLLR
jgi:hypothetical protein